MKLLVVGNSPQSNVFLNSQYVSGYHAEIVLLDNGDIFLTDKGSTNGTYLNGSKLAPDTDVMIRRGDKVFFADMPLDWTRVPEVMMEPGVRKIVGLGSHPRNQIHVAGEKVSRFHATIKQNADGKWYICDHSTNGTTLNNNRIPKDSFVRLKPGDEIRCAGVPVTNPVPRSNRIRLFAGIAAAVCVIAVAAVFAIRNIPGPEDDIITGQQLYSRRASSSVLICMTYHYRVSAGSLDVDYAFGGSDFIINEKGEFEDADGDNSYIIMSSGFYISNDGLIATNLHVARPWLFNDNIQPVEQKFKAFLTERSMSSNPHYLDYLSDVKVEGVVDEMFAIPNDEYFDGHSAMSCVEVAASDNPEIDVAIVKAMLPGKKLTEGSTYVDLSSIPDKSFYRPGTKIYTLGFPMATELQDISKKTIEAIFAEGTMSASNNEYDFGHTAEVAPGSSGSPVFDDHGRLMGMISSAMGNGYNFAVRAEYITKLLDSKDIDY